MKFLALILALLSAPAFAQVAVVPLAPVVPIQPFVQVAPIQPIAPPVLVVPAVLVPVPPAPALMRWQAFWVPQTGLLGRTTWSVRWVAVPVTVVPVVPVVPVQPFLEQQIQPAPLVESTRSDGLRSLIKQ